MKTIEEIIPNEAYETIYGLQNYWDKRNEVGFLNIDWKDQRLVRNGFLAFKINNRHVVYGGPNKPSN